MSFNVNMRHEPAKEHVDNALRTAKKIAAPLLYVLGAALVLFGIFTSYNTYDLVEHGLRAQGTVVRLAPLDDGKGVRFFPVVGFTPADKKHVEFRVREGRKTPAYAVGEAVTVVYNPHNPAQSAVLDRGWENWTVPLSVCFIGGLMLLFARMLMRPSKAAP